MLADYLLPVPGGYLRPCSVPAIALTPVAGGQHCASCQRLVHDFTRATAAEVAQAQAVAPDGWLCGRFRLPKPAPLPGFSRRLRCFVVALVLVVGCGLTAQEALAQVRQTQAQSSQFVKKRPLKSLKSQSAQAPRDYLDGEIIALPENPTRRGEAQTITYAEQMPEPAEGGGMAGLAAYLLKNVRVSAAEMEEGINKVFVQFTVNENGSTANAHIVKSGGPGLDAAVLRAVRAMTNLRPGYMHGKPVKVSVTLPLVCIKPQ